MSQSNVQASVLATVLSGNQATQRDQPRVLRADIRSISSDGMIEVVPVDESVAPFVCDVLQSALNPGTRLEIGDMVLVFSPETTGGLGCVLGRTGAYRPPKFTPDSAASRDSYQADGQPSGVPAHIVIEAAEELTLKCGDASLDLRKDGKLMIRGKDVLTRAKRTQRIKGGTVAIN